MIRISRGGIWGVFEHRALARWLGMGLPGTARDLRFLRWQATGDLAYHEVLARFEIPLEAYRVWISDPGLETVSGGALPPDGPAIWRGPPEVAAPAWWDPSPEMTPDTAWRRVGEYGTLAMKWERGRAYLHLIDTGHAAAASPG